MHLYIVFDLVLKEIAAVQLVNLILILSNIISSKKEKEKKSVSNIKDRGHK